MHASYLSSLKYVISTEIWPPLSKTVYTYVCAFILHCALKQKSCKFETFPKPSCDHTLWMSPCDDWICSGRPVQLSTGAELYAFCSYWWRGMTTAGSSTKCTRSTSTVCINLEKLMAGPQKMWPEFRKILHLNMSLLLHLLL